MMIMIITFDSLFHQEEQKEGAQGEEEEEAGGRRKGGPTGTPTTDADVSTGSTRSGVRCEE